MKFKLNTRVALKENIPVHHLQKGDVATIVEHHPGERNQEDGYSIEIFNTLGETIAVLVVRESEIEQQKTMFCTSDN